MKEAEAAAHRTLEVLGEVDVPTRTHMRWGAPSREIADQAAEDGADLLVLGAGAQGGLHKALLGGTAQQTLNDTTRSVFIARESTEAPEGPVVVLFNSSRWFTNALCMLQSLQLPENTPVCLVALLEPVRPFGGMFLTFNEEIRARRQIAHDAQEEILESHLRSAAEELSTSNGRIVHTIIRDCEPRDYTKAIEEISPGLVVIGDALHGDPTSPERRGVLQLAESLPCSVIVAR